ncbi:MAG: dehydrogenase [Spirochaetia bacterium]|nr:dehydrogenase [Spirochaetia bacterium]
MKLGRRDFLIAAASAGLLAFVAPKVFSKWVGNKKITSEDLAPGAGNFKAIYLDDAKREEFRLFLKNVFHLYPEEDFHSLIWDLTRKFNTDREIYLELVKRVDKIKPLFGDLTYSLPSLKKQKQEMADQTGRLLEGYQSQKRYLEIGTMGRHVSDMKKMTGFKGEAYLLNDTPPAFSPADIMERGQVPRLGKFLDIDDYSPISENAIEPGSVDLATVYIGFHHAPAGRLSGFLDSIHKAMAPGSALVVRDHNATDLHRWTLVALAHDVFNAGLHYSWSDTVRQVRHFNSFEEQRKRMKVHGFEFTGTELYQEGDPTRNALMKFIRV